jgi:hypothetical protein
VANYANYLTLLDRKRYIIKSFEWRTLFTQLASEPTPLVEHSNFLGSAIGQADIFC